MTRTSQRLRPAVAATVVALLAAGSAGVGTPARADTPEVGVRAAHAPATTPAKTPADPVSTAIKKAKASRQPVPVASLTDEYSTTSANPDGTLTRSSSTSPQRVRQAGKWVPIDTTLVRQKDGSYAPKAALSQLSVSGGGSTGLLTMKDGSRTLTFSWTAKLPEPTVHGDTATYAEVLPGVDLQVIADATGYSSMLVVKTAQAAANPALATLDLGVKATGLRLAQTRDGGAEAVDSRTGKQVFQTGTAAMWDSSPAAGEKATAPASTPQEARAAAERLGGHRSKLAVRLASGRQTLTLDQKLLTAKTTRYPVYVDPYWSGNPSQIKWARISSNGWDVYNSTAKTGAASARIGYDNWPTGDAERARTYYQMNTAGIRGAVVFEASLYVVERWAASCYNTDAVIYGTNAPSGWSSSSLYWGHEPAKKTGVLSTVSSKELNCDTSKIAVSPASLKFNVLSYLKTVATGKQSNATFLVEAKDMNDKYSWKQLGYGGGATLSVRYSYKPGLLNGTGKPTTSPSVVDQGRNLTTTHTPTISAKGVNPKVNGTQENVRIEYQVFNSAGSRIKLGYSGYSLNGSSWPVPSLADGTYTWKATVQNASGLWAGVYTATQTMVVDTVAPHAPAVRSSQFPPAPEEGGAYTDKGLFQLGNDKTNNVTGYLFSLDHDLANVVYASTKGTPWTSTTTLAAQTIYYAKADNGNGTGTVVVNGSAGVSFAPITSGAHRLYVKAVDQVGSTSPQTAYTFLAGKWTPTIAYGSKLVSGWTATNTDGTTTTVPAATRTGTGHVVAQAATTSVYFGDGYQALFVDGPHAPGSADPSMTVSFNVPETGAWELGANLTMGTTYGIFDLTFDQGKSTAKSLLTGFNGYAPVETTTTYRRFGALTDANGGPMVLAKGVHTLTWTITGEDDRASQNQAGVDLIRLSPLPTCWINDTTKCRNNTAISTLTDAGITTADADGGGTSVEAADLTAAGWAANATITVNGAAIKLPAAFGNGLDDNMLANGQVVRVPTSGVVNKGNAVVFVGLATSGATTNVSGTINYAATSCSLNSQQFTISSLSDWAYTPAAEAALTISRRNNAVGTRSNVPVGFFAVTVPLKCPGAVVDSITLPVQTNVVQGGVPAMHVFGLGIRPTSVTGSAHWVGSWAAAQDSAALTTPISASSFDGMTNQTMRVPVRLSIGTGGGTQQVRVHLANSLGTAPVTFDAASIALQDSTAGGANAAAAPIPLTFGGSASTTLAAGADVVSDPVTLSAPDRATVLFSLQVHGSRTTLPGHRDGKLHLYLSSSDGLNHTADQSGAAFHTSVRTGLPYLSGIDVTTPASDPDGAVVLFGDQTVNSDTAGSDAAQFSNQLADAMADSELDDHAVQFGVLNQGSSTAGGFKLPTGDPDFADSAGAMVDREMVSQPNVRSVLISAGSTDLLACTATADACATGVTNRLTTLAVQARNFKTDDAANQTVTLPTTTGQIKVYVATLPPFTAGHTADQELARELVNADILGSLNGHVDGTINFASAVSAEDDGNSDTVNPAFTYTNANGTYPNDLYYARLAEAFLRDIDPNDWETESESGTNVGADPVAEWKFGDGNGSTVAKDTGSGTGSTANPTFHNAQLTNVTWGQGRLYDGTAGTFNGTSAYASTDLKTNTTTSFSVSAWVRLADKSADHTVFARNSSVAGGLAPLTIEYNKAADRWQVDMPSAASGGTVYSVTSEDVPQTGIWTHLGVAYDADVQSLTLYVNGNSIGIDSVVPYNDFAGATWIGRGPNDWFSGNVANVRVWAWPIGGSQIDIEHAPISVTDWELDHNGEATVADDSWGNHPGAIVGGATWAGQGHNDDDFDALNLNGVDSWVTAPALLRTDQSFSVAAWVRLTSKSAVYTVVSQEGDHVGRFMLQYRNDCDCWRFMTTRIDSMTGLTVDYADGPSGVELNKWIQVAGVYDASAGTISLYVNGALAAPPIAAPAGWQAKVAFTAGRTRWNDVPSDPVLGGVDAVKVYQGAISADQIAELSTE